MLIAFLEPHLQICGGIRRIIETANGLVERGHRVVVILPDYAYQSGQHGGWLEQKFEITSESLANDWILRHTDPAKNHPWFDVLIFNEETQYKVARKIKADVRVYYALHYSVLHKDLNVLRNCYNGGFHILANSNWTADAMELETLSRPPVIHGGLRHDIFHPVEIGKKFDISTYGATRFWKGGWIADYVAKRLNKTLFKFGNDCGLPQEKLAEGYCQSKVYLSCSYYEGWNWPALEAMACGVPVVMSEDGGSGDYAKDGFNCLKFSPRDAESAAKAVEHVLKDSALRESLIKNGIDTA